MPKMRRRCTSEINDPRSKERGILVSILRVRRERRGMRPEEIQSVAARGGRVALQVERVHDPGPDDFPAAGALDHRHRFAEVAAAAMRLFHGLTESLEIGFHAPSRPARGAASTRR